jgi:hypothetical protein
VEQGTRLNAQSAVRCGMRLGFFGGCRGFQVAVESLVVVVLKGWVGEGEGEGEGEDLDPGMPFHAGVHWWHARSGCCRAVSMRVATRNRTGEGGGRSNRGRGGGTGGHTISIQHHQPMRCRHSSRAPWHNLRCLASPPCVRARPCAEGPNPNLSTLVSGPLKIGSHTPPGFHTLLPSLPTSGRPKLASWDQQSRK